MDKKEQVFTQLVRGLMKACDSILDRLQVKEDDLSNK